MSSDHECPDWGHMSEDGEPQLIIAIRENDFDRFSEELANSSNVDERTPSGKSALIVASETGNIPIMKMLIDAGADINATEFLFELTPLMYAAMTEHEDAVSLLLEYGADTELKARDDGEGLIDGFTASDLAEMKGNADIAELIVNNRTQNNSKTFDSIDALLIEAEHQGWLPNRELAIIPEIMDIYEQATNHFYQLIDDVEPKMRQTLVYHTCRYLFAKAVEGVILWGSIPDGKISVYFHPKHLAGELETEVSQHLHEVVVESLAIGESLFEAHQNWIIHCQNNNIRYNLTDEIRKTIEWIPRFGMNYALNKQYDSLR